ncbi:uncharacterized protein [Henckelia pumila]|uniref:uncharacterized protein n=1 Tax=Henckelia pumila TaxID=405737 RepID=UPI003C6E9B8E
MAEENVTVVLKRKGFKVDRFSCKLTTLGRYVDVSEKIMKYLNPAEMEVMMSRTQFGHLICSANRYKLSGSLLWYLISRQTLDSPKNKFWMVIRKRPIRFSKLEFCLISGLNCSKDIPEIPMNLDFKSRHFGDMDVVFVRNLEDRLGMLSSEGGDEVNLEKLKLACLLFVAGVLLTKRTWQSVTVGTECLRLVEDFDVFNRYPWGSCAYDVVLASLRSMNLSDKLKERNEKK